VTKRPPTDMGASAFKRLKSLPRTPEQDFNLTLGRLAAIRGPAGLARQMSRRGYVGSDELAATPGRFLMRPRQFRVDEASRRDWGRPRRPRLVTAIAPRHKPAWVHTDAPVG